MAFYLGKIVSTEEADAYLAELLNSIEWKNDEVLLFGRRIVTKRKVGWYGDRDFSYSYSNTTRRALPWTSTLLKLKLLVEQSTDETYNSCLLNLYHSGHEG